MSTQLSNHKCKNREARTRACVAPSVHRASSDVASYAALSFAASLAVSSPKARQGVVQGPKKGWCWGGWGGEGREGGVEKEAGSWCRVARVSSNSGC